MNNKILKQLEETEKTINHIKRRIIANKLSMKRFMAFYHLSMFFMVSILLLIALSFGTSFNWGVFGFNVGMWLNVAMRDFIK